MIDQFVGVNEHSRMQQLLCVGLSLTVALAARLDEWHSSSSRGAVKVVPKDIAAASALSK